LLLLAAMFGSLFGSLLRARAGAFGIDLKDVGLVTRFERLLIVFVGVVVNILGPALWVLAVLTNVSAMQRLIHVLIPLYGKPINRFRGVVLNR
jgi:CDP-diacylglycerol---glycerol-3-phosphate 3-phosphatidyltransferase